MNTEKMGTRGKIAASGRKARKSFPTLRENQVLNPKEMHAGDELMLSWLRRNEAVINQKPAWEEKHKNPSRAEKNRHGNRKQEPIRETRCLISEFSYCILVDAAVSWANAEGVGDDDRWVQETCLIDPMCPSHLPTAVETEQVTV